jgi:hypothetical protein
VGQEQPSLAEMTSFAKLSTFTAGQSILALFAAAVAALTTSVVINPSIF